MKTSNGKTQEDAVIASMLLGKAPSLEDLHEISDQLASPQRRRSLLVADRGCPGPHERCPGPSPSYGAVANGRPRRD